MENKIKKIPADPPDRWLETCIDEGETRAEENVNVQKMCKFLWDSKKDVEKAKIYIDNTPYVPTKRTRDETEIDNAQ